MPLDFRTTPGERARVVPERIREARESKGFTVEGFAEELSISRQAVGQYESGQVSPSAEALSKIIALTGQPPAFFTAKRSRDGAGFGTPFWRGLKRMNKPDRLRIGRRMDWASDVVTYIEKYIDLPPVNLPVIEWDWVSGNDAELESIAEKLRDHWGLGRGPIFHLSRIAEVNGIVLIKESVNCDDMDAVSRWQAGRPYVLCSADRDELPRHNFNLAHEIAHLILHQGVEVTVENINKVERQANYFAGAFLLPRAMFAREVVSTSITYFLKLKERWRVSAAAMIYRCKELQILSKSQVSYLFRQLTAKGMRAREPLDTAFKTEQPTLLAHALGMLIEHGVQTRSDIVEALSLNPKDIEQLAGATQGFLGETVVPFKLRTRFEA